MDMEQQYFTSVGSEQYWNLPNIVRTNSSNEATKKMEEKILPLLRQSEISLRAD